MNYNHNYTLKLSIADLNEQQAIRWYIGLNNGGTPHTDEDIERALRLLK